MTRFSPCPKAFVVAWFAVALSTALCLWGEGQAQAQAEQAEQAEQTKQTDHADPAMIHHEQGVTLYRSGRYAEALKEFQQAYKVRPLPRLLLLIGQTHLKLGHPREALHFYRLYQQAEPDPGPDIRERIKVDTRLARALLKEKQGTAQPGPVQVPLDLPTGGPGPPREAGETGDEDPTTGPQPVPPTPAPKAPLVTRAEDPRGLLRAPPRPLADSKQDGARPPLYKRWWFWGALGLVTAGAVTGIVIGTLPRAPQGPPAGVEVLPPSWTPIP